MQKHNLKEFSESGEAVGLLISILLAYPEITLVNYIAEEQFLKLTLLLHKETSYPTEQQVSVFAELRKNILAHASFRQLKLREADLSYDSLDDYIYLHITRDLESFTKEEISLIINWLPDNGFDFITESDNYPLVEEDMAVHEELIAPMLVAIRKHKYHKTFIAYRENGKVLVFNK